MPVSFADQIKPLFRPRDISCMHGRGVLLDDFAYMSNKAGDDTFPDHAHARHVQAHLTGDETPRMPLGGPFWTTEKLALFEQWMTDGYQP